MKKLFAIIAIVFMASCNNGDCTDGSCDDFNGVVTYTWVNIPGYAQSAILSSGVDTSQLIIYNNLTQSQKNTFLSLGLDPAKNYKINQ